jgi:hypothetical protein
VVGQPVRTGGSTFRRPAVGACRAGRVPARHRYLGNVRC